MARHRGGKGEGGKGARLRKGPGSVFVSAPPTLDQESSLAPVALLPFGVPRCLVTRAPMRVGAHDPRRHRPVSLPTTRTTRSFFRADSARNVRAQSRQSSGSDKRSDRATLPAGMKGQDLGQNPRLQRGGAAYLARTGRPAAARPASATVPASRRMRQLPAFWRTAPYPSRGGAPTRELTPPPGRPEYGARAAWLATASRKVGPARTTTAPGGHRVRPLPPTDRRLHP
jgi:hypothetical protein